MDVIVGGLGVVLAGRKDLGGDDELFLGHSVEGLFDLGANDMYSLALIIVDEGGNLLHHALLVLVGTREGDIHVEGFGLDEVQAKDRDLSGQDSASYHILAHC